ncbi:MAG: HEPN domain-containing protein [Dehalococcoidia bacterium]|nr:MAG: HEPN domain-containing protein [Dehalococcoidia bacterium]
MHKKFWKDKRKLIDDWLEIAYEDFEVANYLYREQKRYLYMAYMCQQSIEKAIKAVIQQNDKIPQKIHKLDLIAKDADIWKLLGAQQKNFLKSLSMFYIATRYPGIRGKLNKDLTSQRAASLLNSTKEMLLWLCRYLRNL